jgi:hypothetical protein
MKVRSRWIAGSLGILGACALISVGCGGGDDTASTTATDSSVDTAQQRIDAAVESCTTNAQQLGDAAGAALEAACTTVGANVKQALSEGGEQVDQALSQAADSCNSAVAQLPAGEAQAALTELCDAISSAE